MKDKLNEMLTARNIVIAVVLLVGSTYAFADIFGANVVAGWFGGWISSTGPETIK